ncbi:MAG: hypothetical protein M3352_08955 [Bacteroidota bacterium]|nr:hypothetical protein [Bacteroidota bacterium]
MSQAKLNVEEDFLVKESVTFNYVAGIILLTVFIVSMAAGDYGWANYLSALAILLIPGAFFIARARRNTTSIKINKHGFYFAGKLITSWENFFDAVLSQEEKLGSIQDNFIILIRYYGSDKTVLYSLKIPLSNTQDKAEEEIINAKSG